jgi:hypothetical protein
MRRRMPLFVCRWIWMRILLFGGSMSVHKMMVVSTVRIQNELALGSSRRDCGRGIDCDTINVDSNGLHTTVGELQLRIVLIGVQYSSDAWKSFLEILEEKSGKLSRSIPKQWNLCCPWYFSRETLAWIGVWGCFVIWKLMGGLEMRVLLRQFQISWETALLKSSPIHADDFYIVNERYKQNFITSTLNDYIKPITLVELNHRDGMSADDDQTSLACLVPTRSECYLVPTRYPTENVLHDNYNKHRIWRYV